jgi:hypothetical protein
MERKNCELKKLNEEMHDEDFRTCVVQFSIENLAPRS